MSSTAEHYNSNELFDEPSLEPLTVRFYEDTSTIIKQIADDHGISQAGAVRRLVHLGLEEVSDR